MIKTENSKMELKSCLDSKLKDFFIFNIYWFLSNYINFFG